MRELDPSAMVLDMSVDSEMRLAAFRQLAALSAGGPKLRWADLQYGFEFEGRRYLLAAQQGIWKPKEMDYVLSLRTGRGPDAERYIDHRVAEQSARYEAVDRIQYAFRGDDAEHRDNRHLVSAFAMGAPLIYLLAVGVGEYVAAAPTYIAAIDKLNLRCDLVFGSPDRGPAFGIPDIEERRAGMRAFRARVSRATT